MPNTTTNKAGIEVLEARVPNVPLTQYERWKKAAAVEERTFAAWVRFHLSSIADELLSDSRQHRELGVSPAPPARTGPAFRPPGR